MGNPTILVVEDEQAIAEMIMTSLEMAGFQVKRAANGQIAYQMVLDVAPDLILADWMMPMMTGLELAKRIKRDEKNLRNPHYFINR